MDACNLLGYTIYPIHLAQDGPVDLPRSGTVAAGGGSGVGYSAAGVGTPHHAGLLAVAEETGGKLLLPGNNKHLSRIAADTRAYYWLGFTHSGDARSHGVQVKVSRPGLEVRTRKSFVPLSREGRLDLDLEKALLAKDTRGMGILNVALGAFTKTDKDEGELPVIVRIPVDKITLTQHGGLHHGKLELRIAAIDDDGNRSDVPVMPIDIAREDAPKPGSVVRYDTRLRLRHTPQDIQLVLYDTQSGKSFAERVRVQP
ncbi:MAG TPA: hypothetical protein VHN15_13750 [Thermoanaerobaculia bacterium]|nr:hypothetical protein [Thermoanaerobaculia bacterium]